VGDNGTTEYAIKQTEDRYYPVIIDREAGGHYEIKNPMTDGTLSYNNPEAAERYVQRAREKQT
jgi:guanylate kinase